MCSCSTGWATKVQLELGRLRCGVCSEAGKIVFCFGDERDLMEMVVLKMGFQERMERWAGTEVKHDWCSAQFSWRPDYVQGSRREKSTSYDVMDQSSSVVFPTCPVILDCPFGDERFYYCCLILFWWK